MCIILFKNESCLFFRKENNLCLMTDFYSYLNHICETSSYNPNLFIDMPMTSWDGQLIWYIQDFFKLMSSSSKIFGIIWPWKSTLPLPEITGLCTCKWELLAYDENKLFCTYVWNKARRWAGNTSSFLHAWQMDTYLQV